MIRFRISGGHPNRMFPWGEQNKNVPSVNLCNCTAEAPGLLKIESPCALGSLQRIRAGDGASKHLNFPRFPLPHSEANCLPHDRKTKTLPPDKFLRASLGNWEGPRPSRKGRTVWPNRPPCCTSARTSGAMYRAHHGAGGTAGMDRRRRAATGFGHGGKTRRMRVRLGPIATISFPRSEAAKSIPGSIPPAPGGKVRSGAGPRDHRQSPAVSTTRGINLPRWMGRSG